MKFHKKMTNLEIAILLRAIAAAYQIKGEDKNKFRIIAYQRAADAVEHLSSEAKDLWDEGKLKDIPGVGESIAAHLSEIFDKGVSKHFETIMEGLPPGMFELTEVPGIGAKSAYKLAKNLKIKTIEDLEKVAKEGKIGKLDGFGEQSQAEVLKSIVELKGREKRLILPYASKIASEVISWLRKNKAVKRADPLGSLRRQASTIGDIDIAVATSEPKKVLNHFVAYPKATRTLEKGEKTASIIVPGNIQVDLMVQAPGAYGALLQHLTGSKHHNIALREHALKRGLSLSEYGIKKTKDQKSKVKIYSTEEEFYKALGLAWIPPELREDTGEIEAALDKKLPNLIEINEVKGDLQIHSDFDIETSHDLGESSMEEVISEANSLNYEYLAFTEHNPSRSGHKDKEIVDILKRKREVIDKINYSLMKRVKDRVKKVYNSLEIDILPTGELPVPEKGLEILDFALVSIHSSFRMNRQKATKRVLAALAHPKVKILAHPTARKLNFREGIELDWPQIFDFCKNHNKWLEINAEPMRLDLPDFLVREAVKQGVKLSLGTDAHHREALGNMIYGVSVARRGWASASDIVNTSSLEEFEKMIE